MASSETPKAEPGLSGWRIFALVSVILLTLALIGGGVAIQRTWLRQGWPVLGTEDADTFFIHEGKMAVLRGHGGDSNVTLVDLVTDDRTEPWAGGGDGQAIAMDDEWIVWSVCRELGVMPCTGVTYAMKHDGSERTEVLDKPADRIAIGGGRTYIVSGNRAFIGPSGQGAAPAMRSTSMQDVVADDGHVYWLTVKSVLRGTHAQLEADHLVDVLGLPGHMVMGPDALYVSCASPPGSVSTGSIERIPLDGSPMTRTTQVLDPGVLVASRTGVVFVFHVPLSADGSSRSSMLGYVPYRGGSAEVLLERSGWGPLGVHDGDVYLGNPRYVYRRSLGGR